MRHRLTSSPVVPHSNAVVQIIEKGSRPFLCELCEQETAILVHTASHAAPTKTEAWCQDCGHKFKITTDGQRRVLLDLQADADAAARRQARKLGLPNLFRAMTDSCHPESE